LNRVSAVIAPSPYLLDQCPSHIPKLLVRSVVSAEILRFGQGSKTERKNWVVFSGTHERTQGLEQMVKAWRMLSMPEWELHIAGKGPLTPVLEKLAEGDPSIHFHGFLNREENARLLCAGKIGMNPQDLTRVLGSVFAFKICEYLAAGLHVITTPRGNLERDLEAGVTYIQDNSAETIAACLNDLIRNRRFEQSAQEAAIQTFGMAPLSKALNGMLAQMKASAKEDAAKECQPA
jgi:glycosyltransferase involved in cell wall biosynthesis